MHGRLKPEEYLNTALSVISTGSRSDAVLDQLPVPLYTTDAEGLVTYWNRACVDFAGRVPQLGSDRWCVTWKIFSTAGERIPHDQCPMAEAIHRKQPVRGHIAIAERPDGRRVAFRPYPTPIKDDGGNVTGAVNILIDVTEEQSAALIEQADRCRRLADATYDRNISNALGTMAEGFERTAQDLKAQRD